MCLFCNVVYAMEPEEQPKTGIGLEREKINTGDSDEESTDDTKIELKKLDSISFVSETSSKKEKNKTQIVDRYDLVTFTSSDNARLLVNPNLLHLTPSALDELNSNKRILLQDLNGEELTTVGELLASIKDLNLGINGEFAFQDVEPIISEKLNKRIAVTKLGKFFKSADDMGANSLTDVFGHLLAKKLIGLYSCNLNNLFNCLRASNLNLSEKLQRYLRKHIVLIELGQQELTIADYFVIHQVHRSALATHKLTLHQKGLTSVFGIEAMPRPGEIVEIILSRNCIMMNPDTDTMLLESPFRMFTNLRVLNLEKIK